MALLMAQVELDTIWLLGRWHSNTILPYLHTTAKSFTCSLSIQISQYVDYAILPTVHADL